MTTSAVTAGAVEVTVRALATGGDGVADLPDGRVVFVPRTAPGDRALITIGKSRARWARASVLQILEPAAGRVAAPCALYDRCGGCQLQHVPYDAQLEWKGRFVTDALERIGKLEGVPVPEVVPSPSTERYRSRMTFTLRRLRGGRVVAGMHGLDRPSHVVDVHGECLLPREGVLRAWTDLRAAWGPGARRLPEGGRLRLTLRAVDGGVELFVDGGAPGWSSSSSLLDDLPGLMAVWHRPSDEEEAVVVAGASAPGRGDAFEQVNEDAAQLLRAHVISEVTRGDPPPARVIDAYCGAGRVGRAVAALGPVVEGIEVNASAVAAARMQAPEGFTVVQGVVEERLAELLPADVLVLNPPRSGLVATIPEQLRNDPPGRIVYVSCDPATLARDLALLDAAFELDSATCFDLFPHTAHVETVATLRRRRDS